MFGREMPRLAAAVDDDWLVDVALASESIGRPGAGSSALLVDLLTVLRAGPPAMAAVRDVVDAVREIAVADRRQPMWIRIADARLGPPVTRPSKIVCIGLNYVDHARESGLPIPASPVVFSKFPSSLAGHGGEVVWRGGDSAQVDYEGEFAFIIGRRARDVAVDQALDYVGGYTIVNDISARDAQARDGQWTLAKSFDTFCPVGPFMVTPDEVDNPGTLRIRTLLNGHVVQESCTDNLVFGVAELIAYISRFATLEVGDLVATGTPGGVGISRTPPRLLADGDVVEVFVDHVGTLRNTMRVVA